MMGTYPLLHAQYTTAKREIQEVCCKNGNKPACIEMAARMCLVKNLKYSGQGRPPVGNGGRRRRQNKQKGVMD